MNALFAALAAWNPRKKSTRHNCIIVKERTKKLATANFATNPCKPSTALGKWPSILCIHRTAPCKNFERLMSCKGRCVLFTAHISLHPIPLSSQRRLIPLIAYLLFLRPSQEVARTCLFTTLKNQLEWMAVLLCLACTTACTQTLCGTP